MLHVENIRGNPLYITQRLSLLTFRPRSQGYFSPSTLELTPKFYIKRFQQKFKFIDLTCNVWLLRIFKDTRGHMGIRLLISNEKRQKKCYLKSDLHLNWNLSRNYKPNFRVQSWKKVQNFQRFPLQFKIRKLSLLLRWWRNVQARCTWDTVRIFCGHFKLIWSRSSCVKCKSQSWLIILLKMMAF